MQIETELSGTSNPTKAPYDHPGLKKDAPVGHLEIAVTASRFALAFQNLLTIPT